MKHIILAGIAAAILGSAACTAIPTDNPPVAIKPAPQAGLIGPAAQGPAVVDKPSTTLIGPGAQGPATPPANGPLIGDAAE